MSELTRLKILKLLNEQQMCTAQANLDLARGGEWRMDYSGWHSQLSCEIEELLKEASDE